MAQLAGQLSDGAFGIKVVFFGDSPHRPKGRRFQRSGRGMNPYGEEGVFWRLSRSSRALVAPFKTSRLLTPAVACAPAVHADLRSAED